MQSVDERRGDGELHLFIVWEKGGYRRDDILEDIAKDFAIQEVREIEWSAARFARNLSRFYGTKLPPRSFKEKHCGTGPFTLVIVRDERPRYADRSTSKGVARVNARMFDAKARYRGWTGGGHKIHATNSPEETRHDLMLLLGIDCEDYRPASPGGWDGRIVREQVDVPGHRGWSSLPELLRVLNASVRYVILRNYEHLPEALLADAHPDIDILTDAPSELAYVANAQRVHGSRSRVLHTVRIAGRDVDCDLRSPGDGYYDEAWAQAILRDRRLLDAGFYVPSEEDHFYSLAYHALVHKREIAPDYGERLARMARGQGLGPPPTAESEAGMDRPRLLAAVRAYLERHRYRVTMPRDPSVFFDGAGLGRVRAPLGLRLRRGLRDRLVRFGSRAWVVRARHHTRHLTLAFIWLLRFGAPLRASLAHRGYTRVRPVQLLRWKSDARYFEARNGPTGTPVFLKHLDDRELGRREVEVNRRLEARIAAERRFFPRLEKVECCGGHQLMVFEAIRGTTLHDRITRGPAPSPGELHSWARQIVELVSGLHTAGIVHRDLRPHNILVEHAEPPRAGRLHLIDFTYAVDLASHDELGREIGGTRVNRERLMRLGHGFNPAPGCWDDACSALRVLDWLGAAAGSNHAEERSEIGVRLGMRRFPDPRS